MSDLYEERNSGEKIQKNFQKFVSALVNIVGSYQDAMFLYLSVLITNDLREHVVGDSRHISRYEILGLSSLSDDGNIDVYMVRKNYYATGGHSGASADLDSFSKHLLDTYQKDKNGQWVLLQTQVVVKTPADMFWIF